MRRPTPFLPSLALPLLVLACSNNTGQNLLETLPDGYTRIPLYEAGAAVAFDGSFESGDAPADVSSEGNVDAPVDVQAESTNDAVGDAPPADGKSDAPGDAKADAPHDGAGPG